MPKRKKSAAEPAYEVGYCKPPEATRFQKGQPRPPRKEKPVRPRSIEDYIAAELCEEMTFVENGREQRMPKGQVLAKATVNRSIKDGTLKHVKGFLPTSKAEETSEFSEADLALIARFLEQWTRSTGGNQ